MDLPQFLKDLCEEGRVIAPPISSLTAEELAGADQCLRLIESQYRVQMPGTPPDLDVATAREAAIFVYRVCQFVAYRDYGPDAIEQHLATDDTNTASPSAHYSVDLTLRFLPTILRFAKSAAKDDPLLDHILRMARRWPLSSVGMGELGGLSIEGIVTHKSLLTLYVDRIIECHDTSRLDDPGVIDATRQALGVFDDLAPEIARVVAGSD